MVLTLSCITVEKSGLVEDEDLSLSRKYVGDYIGYRYSGPADFGWPNTILIKTSQDSLYGKISAYCNRCDFRSGERLYIRKAFESPDNYGYWIFQIENEDKISYKLSEFQDGNRYLTRSFR
jgi:hypothetical protein